MRLIPVHSSMLAAVGYDAEHRELAVVFSSGQKYKYRGVDRDTFEELLHAQSKGRYMNEHIIGVYQEA